MPPQRPFSFLFFLNCDLDIRPSQMALTLVLKNGFYPKEYIYMLNMKALTLTNQKLWPM